MIKKYSLFEQSFKDALILYIFLGQVALWLELTQFKCREMGVRGSNPDPCIYYALSMPIELISRGQFFRILQKLQLRYS